MTSESQTSGTVLMVRPAAFGFHAEAARSNAFAFAAAGEDSVPSARQEFDALADTLRAQGLVVVILDDSPNPPKPDAVYPNNWVSFHGDGTMILYPMATAARRPERRGEAIKRLLGDHGFAIRRTIDLSRLEKSDQFLEGTGSLILDRPRAVAYAALGPRTSRAALDAFAEATGYHVLAFDCADRAGRPIYHTNVLMSLGTNFAIVCTEAIVPADRSRVLEAIADSGREIIPVGFAAMERFACNLIELQGAGGPVVALSEAALDSLSADQRAALERHGRLAATAIPTIERVGGGSVRCMIADVHLPRST